MSAGLAIFRLRSLNGELAAVRAGGEGVQVSGALFAIGAPIGIEGSTLRTGNNQWGGKRAAERAAFEVGGVHVAARAGA